MPKREEEIKKAYRDILLREADSKGLKASVNSELSVEKVKEKLKLSREYQEKILPVHNMLKKRGGKKKILLFGAYGNGNMGDAIQADFIRKGFEAAGFDGEVWATSYLQGHFDYDNDRKLPYWAIKSKEVTKRFDMIVVGGGGLLAHPHYPLNNEAWAKGLNTKISIISIGATSRSENESDYLIRNASYVSARDVESYNFLKRKREDVELVRDPVLSMRPLVDKEKKTREKTMWVLKGPIEEAHYTIRKYIKKGDFVVGFERKNDQEIEKIFPEIVYIKTINSFDKMANECSRFFTMRYHGLIASLSHSRNIISCGGPKNKSLLRDLGMAERFVTSKKNLESSLSENFQGKREEDFFKKAQSDFISSLQTVISLL